MLLGCADDEAPLGLCDGKPCPSHCRALSAEGSCDVRDTACQELIFTAVGCVRGGILVTDEKLARQLARELADALPHALVSRRGAEVELRVAEDPALLETWSSPECVDTPF